MAERDDAIQKLRELHGRFAARTNAMSPDELRRMVLETIAYTIQALEAPVEGGEF